MGKTADNFAEWRLRESLREYDFYVHKFKRLLLTMFDWQNLPDEISTRFLETKLYEKGMMIAWKDNGALRITQATPIGNNAQEEPVGYRAYSIAGDKKYVKAMDCVPIWNDYFRRGNMENVCFFAKRLSNIEKTIDINLEQLKHPFIISCPEGQRESVKAVITQVTNGEPWIFVDEDFNSANNIKVFGLGIENNIPDLEDTKHEIVNEALTFFGINNVNVVKKERLVTGEAQQNDEQIWLNRNAMFKSRREAVEAINEKFRTNITVGISSSLEENVKAITGTGVK